MGKLFTTTQEADEGELESRCNYKKQEGCGFSY